MVRSSEATFPLKASRSYWRAPRAAQLGERAQPSAIEQRKWASEKLSEFQAKEKALDLDKLRNDLREANLPEARAEEVLGAIREIIRDYQAAIDTLTVVIDKEAQQGSPDSSERITPPKDNSEADALRERLSGLRAQVQTAATQVKLDEETLTRQQSALKTANQEFRRAQEEFDTAKADAVIGLAAGYIIAKTLARLVRARLGRRFSVEIARAAFLEKVTFYFLLVLVVFATLNWLRIPLTAFAFLGGAIAIGVGFGAQTLMNNFISGLILLAEQRIKVGDLIDVDGHLGRVVNLGTRCSRVRKFDGVDVLVPNSYLLEKNVVNWTLSDSHHRYDFNVGVAYGTPTELVMSTLTSALEAQSDVLKEPAAVVAFEAFGDNALTFHIYFWLDIGRSDALKVGTEIRLRIDRLCREASIEMAYPQRDIHLHAADPIAVRIENRETTAR